MKWRGLNELREQYLSFFESKNHTRMASAPLIPQGDNSLLLINSEQTKTVRISKLCDELKNAIDEGVISIRAGVELSYLDDESQKAVSELLKTEKIDMKKAAEIRSAAGENGSIDMNSLKNLYLAKSKPKQEIYKIQKHKIRRFFSEDAKSEEIEEIIERALEMYFSGAEEGKQ